MNLRRMTYEPLRLDNIHLLSWRNRKYKILEDPDDIGEFDCSHCDAHKHRIQNEQNIVGGVCPDNDEHLDWKCFAGNISRILQEVKNES